MGVLGDLIEFSTGIITDIGQVGLALQALGIVIVLAIIFEVVGFFLNRKRLEEIYVIKNDMKRIERKIDRILENQGRR